MSNFVLSSEPTEAIANRQYARIQHLQSENQLLQEQFKDLEKALRLNKELLKIALETTSQNNQSANNSNSATTNNSSAEIPSQVQSLLKLHEENVQLSEKHLKITEERNLAQNKLLLQQQIQEESQGFNQDVIYDLEDKLLELRRCLQDKEYAIQEIEKNRTLKDTQGQFIKIREIVTPNEQTLRLHEELESTRQLLNKMSIVSQNLTEQNSSLREMNFNFKRELIKLRVVLRSPVAFYKMKQFIYDDQQGQPEEPSDIQPDIESHPTQPQSSLNPESLQSYGYQNAQQSQIKYLSNNERAIYQEKLQKSETQLKGFKELFEKEKNYTKYLQQHLEDHSSQLDKQQDFNSKILKSLEQKDNRIKKVYGELNYYRSEYGNYMYLLKNKREVKQQFTNEKSKKMPSFDQIKQQFKQKFLNTSPKTKSIHSEENILPAELNEQVSKESSFTKSVDNLNVSQNDEIKNKNVNVSILNENNKQSSSQQDDEERKDDDEMRQTIQQMKPAFIKKGLTIQTEQDPVNFQNLQKYTTTTLHKSKPQRTQIWNQFKMNLLECKRFLINSAKEFDMTYSLRMTNLQKKLLINNKYKGWSKPLPIWHQKSSSDPLDYFINQENEEQNNQLFVLDESNIHHQNEQKPIKKVSMNEKESFFFSDDDELQGMQ